MIKLKALKDIFQEKILNRIKLLNGSSLSSDLTPVQVGEENTIVELSDSEIRVRGKIEADDIDAGSIKVNGVAVVTTANDNVLTDEQVQDIVGAMVTGNTETNIGVTYQDLDGTLDFAAEIGAADLSDFKVEEEIEDIVGAMITGNTENNIAVTYDDSDGTLDFDVQNCTKTIRFTAQTGTNGVSIDWSAGNKYHLALNSTSTVTFATNPGSTCNLILKVTQPAAGSKTITWAVTSGSIKWAGGTAPSLTTTGDKVDIISFYFDGTDYYGVPSLNF